MRQILNIDENVKKLRIRVWVKQKSLKIAEETSEKRNITS